MSLPLGTDESDDRAHVVLLVHNEVTVDPRVLKYAASLVQSGLRVTCLGISGDGTWTESSVNGARIIRVPVNPLIRSYRDTHGVRGITRRVRPSFSTRLAANQAHARFDLTSRELIAERGRLVPIEGDTVEPPVQRPTDRVRRAATWRYLKAWRFEIYVREGLLNRRLRRKSLLSGETRQRLLDFYLGTPGLARWRRVVPEIQDFELTLGWVLDRLEPDAIHPHDVYLIGVAERAAARARLNGRRVRLVYDAREYVPGLAIPPARVVAAYRDLEKEYIRRYDRVITVAEPIADELQRANRLPRRPDLVMNVPVVAPDVPDGPDVRREAGLADDVPLLLYGGGLAMPRGVHTIVEALPQLPGVHLAVVSRGTSSYTVFLDKLAEERGVADRVHIVPFVPSDQIAQYFRSATVGVSSLLHAQNHDWALTNKFFEYLHAGLPIITSDTQVQVDLVGKLGVGESYVAGDADDFARVARQVLGDLDRYRAAITDEVLETYSWDAQARVLHRIYDELLGPLPNPPGHVASLEVGEDVEISKAYLMGIEEEVAEAAEQTAAAGGRPDDVDEGAAAAAEATLVAAPEDRSSLRDDPVG